MRPFPTRRHSAMPRRRGTTATHPPNVRLAGVTRCISMSSTHAGSIVLHLVLRHEGTFQRPIAVTRYRCGTSPAGSSPPECTCLGCLSSMR